MIGRGKEAVKSLGEGLLLHLTSIFTLKGGCAKLHQETVHHLIILYIMTLNKQNGCAVIINGRRKT
jgi:hypothetical protein